MKKKTTSGLKIICLNRKASFNYFFESLLEAGIVLKGSEIKSVREGKVNISDSYAVEKKGEIVLINSHIENTKFAGNMRLFEGTGMGCLVVTDNKIGLENEAEKYALLLGYNYKSSKWYEASYRIINKDYKIKKISNKNEKENILKKFIKLFK